MLRGFQKFIEEKKLFLASDPVLLAVSGGMDSVCLCELFSKSGFNFAIAHCNFGLRENESENDELFVKEIAGNYGVPFFSKKFNTQEFSTENGISIQMAARELRYEWFNELCRDQNYMYVATAHHLNDSIETLLLNLLRGTGIAGMTGIRAKNDKIIRPLLFSTRSEIENFAKENKLQWREDSSNFSTDYTRNELRHSVIPLLKKINPSFDETMKKNMNRFQESEMMFNLSINNFKNEIITKKDEAVFIDYRKIRELSFRNTLLHEILKDYNFKEPVIMDIISGVDTQPGKKFYSSSHILIRDREHLILSPIMHEIAKEYLIEAGASELFEPFHLIFGKNTGLEKTNNTAILDHSKLKFPLTLRKWKNGDAFQPSGMKGKKKLSDFFIDKKLSLHEKNSIWVILSADEIIWVVGQRLDERYKATADTNEIYSILLKEKS